MPGLSAVSKDVSAFSVQKNWLPTSAGGRWINYWITEKNEKLKGVYSNKTHLYLHFLGVIFVI